MEDNVARSERGTRETRLAGFVKSHFAISGVGFAVSLPVFAFIMHSTEETLTRYDLWAVPGVILLLLLYAVAGYWSARKKQWGPFGSWKEGLWAFLDPALIAWGWGALVLLSFYLNVWPLLLFLFCGSLFLASPSFIMVLLALVYHPFVFGLPGLWLWAFLAGGIPPLLFFLGSLIGGKESSPTKEGTEISETGV